MRLKISQTEASYLFWIAVDLLSLQPKTDQ